MKEFDNIKIEQIAEILNEDTTLKRFYPLLPVREVLITRLLTAGIVDKYMFFDVLSNSVQKLAETIGIEIEVLVQLESFLHLHDYTNRRLSEIKSVNSICIQKLKEKGIKYTKDYLLICLNYDIKSVSSEYEINIKDAKQLFSYCDLMRLPGVKDIRASLYYDCDYRSLQIFSVQNAADMRQHIADYIAGNGLQKSVPALKELCTQVAVARVLPHFDGDFL